MVLDARPSFVEATELHGTEVRVPPSFVDLFEADVLADQGAGDVVPLLLPTHATVGADVANLEAIRVLDGGKLVGHGAREKYPESGKGRQVTKFGRDLADENDPSQKMRQAIDSPEGRRRYSQRIATVEPVFANIRHHKGIRRFTLRSRVKVKIQWLLYCLVHNIEKMATRAAYAT
jgi:hypothetical protein